MTNHEILADLKIDLQISTDAMDKFLCKRIDEARVAIKIEGITIDPESVADGELVEMYAAYLYRHRRENVPMPRMLRYALNNRLMHEKGKANG